MDNSKPVIDSGHIALSENTNKDASLPKRHRSSKQVNDDIAIDNRDADDIRQPHDGDSTLPSLVVHALHINVPETNTITEGSTKSENMSRQNSDESSVLQNDDNVIAPFPPVVDGEIDMHRLMNEEAESYSTSKPIPNRYQGYLKRLQLERKLLSVQRVPKELKVSKRKRLQSKPKVAKEPKDEVFLEEIPVTFKRRESDKSIKLILGFRYSYALEQYYRDQMTNYPASGTTHHDIDDADSDEVMNGWIVKSLGPTVLNLRARTMPSCNPIELRLRRRMRKMNGSRRTVSMDSSASRAMLKSQHSLSKLITIKADRELKKSYQEKKERNVVTCKPVGVGADIKDHSALATLPPICSPERMLPAVPTSKKAISLKLPPINP